MLSDKPKQNPEPIFSDFFLEENDRSQEFTLSDSSLSISQNSPQTRETNKKVVQHGSLEYDIRGEKLIKDAKIDIKVVFSEAHISKDVVVPGAR